MTKDERINGENETALQKLLIGRSIIKAEDDALTLDDGTELLIEANQGGCVCSAGDYEVMSVDTFPNAITRVDVEHDDPDENSPYLYGERITIHVYAEGASAEVVAVEGDEGNGYYGRGFEVIVRRKEVEQ